MARPRILLNDSQTRQKLEAETLLAPARKKQGSKLNTMQVDRILAKKRSAKYMDAISRLDAGGHVHNKHKVDAVLAIIQEELPEIEIDLGPIGIIAKCYLGEPYEVHTLDVTGSIIEHYKKHQGLPNGFERARGLAAKGQYAFIEVYHNALRAVSDDGTVATIKE